MGRWAGLLHVGPSSAGAVPGPACYGQGGVRPTVTDAALVLGIIDPAFFLGGSIALDRNAALAAVQRDVAVPLGTTTDEAAHAILALATENMVQAIMDITVNQGIDPRQAVLVGGGGGAGLNMVAIGRRLGVAAVVIPRAGAALSAAGALLSDLTHEYRATRYTHTAHFERDGANAVLETLEDRAQAFVARHGAGARASTIEFFIEARYPDQVWEIEVPLRAARFHSDADLDALMHDFHAMHREIFAVADPQSPIEIVGWSSRAACTLRAPGLPTFAAIGPAIGRGINCDKAGVLRRRRRVSRSDRRQARCDDHGRCAGGPGDRRIPVHHDRDRRRHGLPGHRERLPADRPAIRDTRLRSR